MLRSMGARGVENRGFFAVRPNASPKVEEMASVLTPRRLASRMEEKALSVWDTERLRFWVPLRLPPGVRRSGDFGAVRFFR